MSEGTVERAEGWLAPLLRHLLAAALGGLLAIALYKLWGLEGRWFYAVIIGVIGLSAAMALVAVFSDFVMICFFLAIPLAGFGKWFFPGNLRDTVWSSNHHNATMEGILGLGLVDFAIVAFYMSWFYRIFVLREEELPKVNLIDFFVALLFAAYVISIPGTAKPNLGLHATAYLFKFVLLYFYLSRNLQARHLPWFIGSVIFAILLEGALGAVQHTTGRLVGLALDKGSGTALDYQYQVPGTSGWYRATGTLYDSHTLGLYMAMLGPFMLAMTFWRSGRPLLNLIFGGALVLSLAILIMTLTRSGWVASAVSMTLAIFLMLFVWREGRLVPFLVVFLFVILLSAPWSVDMVIERIQRAPEGTVNVRLQGYEVAAYIWSQYPIFGFGAGNFMEAHYLHSYGWNQDIVVHNTILLLGTEVGVLGVVGFYGAIFVAAWRLWKIGKTSTSVVRRLAFGAVIALAATVVEGMATPVHREPTAYTMLWLLIAMGVALPRIEKERAADA
jgi:O-antigen ligase